MNFKLFLENGLNRFSSAILANPQDHDRVLVFSDWLDDETQPEKAEFTRKLVQIIKKTFRPNIMQVSLENLANLLREYHQPHDQITKLLAKYIYANLKVYLNKLLMATQKLNPGQDPDSFWVKTRMIKVIQGMIDNNYLPGETNDASVSYMGVTGTAADGMEGRTDPQLAAVRFAAKQKQNSRHVYSIFWHLRQMGAMEI